MSDADREVLEVGDIHRGADGGGDDDDDGHDRESATSGTQIRKKKKREYDGFRKNFTKAKQVFHREKSTSSNSGDRGSSSSCFCFSGRHCTLESTNASDPNDPNFFSYDMLKTLIEKNDFYSIECNTHLR